MEYAKNTFYWFVTLLMVLGFLVLVDVILYIGRVIYERIRSYSCGKHDSKDATRYENKD